MIGARSRELSSPAEDPESQVRSVAPPRFDLKVYNKAKKDLINAKIEKTFATNQEIQILEEALRKKEQVLKQLNNKAACVEEKIRRRKRKIADRESLLLDEGARKKKPRQSRIRSEVSGENSEKLINLSTTQFLKRRKSTLRALQSIHCGSKVTKLSDKVNSKPIYDGMWTTLVNGATKEQMTTYINNSSTCVDSIIPSFVKSHVKSYEKSTENKVRSMRVLYQGGLVGKRKYTKIRNSADVVKTAEKKRTNLKTEFLKGCEVPTLLPYKSVMSYIRSIDIGELVSLNSMPAGGSLDTSGFYRPLKSLLIRLADMYLFLHDKVPCLKWFNGEENVLRVAVGADGAPFGKDETATAYLVSILNLLKGVQSCNENHLLVGSNLEEDHPVMKEYTKHLQKEMEEIDGMLLTTDQGRQVKFIFELVPCDMKWASSMSGELNNCATYFSPFANVNQKDKETVHGSIGGQDATWQPWDYKKRIETARKVELFKKTLKKNLSPEAKRSQVTKHIASLKSRQEYNPPLGKYVDLIKAEPLHNTNNAWQRWFLCAFSIALQYTTKAQLSQAVVLSDLPISSPLMGFMKCLKETAKAGRLYKNVCRWFGDGRKKKQSFSVRFTGLESKQMSWYYAFLVKQLLDIPDMSKGSQLKLHTLAFIGMQLREAASIYSRVDITREQVAKLKIICQQYFAANQLLLGEVNPTVWTIGYAIPYHTSQLFDTLGSGLGLNSMQGREAKHIQLAKYLVNTSNVNKHSRWPVVFRHEYVSRVWLREMDPYSTACRRENPKSSESFIPKNVLESDGSVCYCGLPKTSVDGCVICSSSFMGHIKLSVQKGKVCLEIKKWVEKKA